MEPYRKELSCAAKSIHAAARVHKSSRRFDVDAKIQVGVHALALARF
jgi:hypothetical protein